MGVLARKARPAPRTTSAPGNAMPAGLRSESTHEALVTKQPHALEVNPAAGNRDGSATAPGAGFSWDFSRIGLDPSQGVPLDSATRSRMEPKFGRDFSGVRVHTGRAAAESAKAVNARAYTLGRNIVFAEGQYAPGTIEGNRLIAHELVHTAQQQRGTILGPLAITSEQDAGEREARNIARTVLAGLNAGPITPQAPCVARAPADETKKEEKQEEKKSPPYMGYNPDLGDVADLKPEPMNTVGVVDVPIISLFARKPPHAPVGTITSGTTIVVKGIIHPTDAHKQPVYVALYHGRMANKQSEQVEVLVPLAALAVSSQGPAKPQPSAAQTANDWMAVVPEKGKKGDAEALKPVLAQIKQARAEIETRKLSKVPKNGPNQPREGLKSEADDKTTEYDKWLRNKDTHPRLAKGPDDIRWNVLRRFFAAEGRPSDMMTYDSTNITWGPGFSGMGQAGITEQAMARLFNQSEEAKDAFWKVGLTVVGVDLVMVDIKDADKGLGQKLHGTAAENVLRVDRKLVSFFINVSQGLTEPGQTQPSDSLRQKVLDAHFETFLNTTLRNSEGTIEGMEEKAAAVAAHAVHSGNHGWGEFRGAKTLEQVEERIKARIKVLEKENEAKDEKVFIVPLEHIERNLDQKFIDE